MSASLYKTGRDLAATVRPNRALAQAFEPDIPAKNRRQSLTIALLRQDFLSLMRILSKQNYP
jgi:hypothetical protein